MDDPRTSAPVIGDDEIKRRLGIDSDRTNGAYSMELPETEDLQTLLAQNYLEPGCAEIHEPGEAVAAANREIDSAREQIRSFLATGDLVMVVPMRETGPVTKPLLSTVTKLMVPDNITVVNHDSDDDAVWEVQRHQGVRLPYWKGPLDTLDWPKLLPVLNLPKRPEGFGKGLSVLAGYLYQYFLALAFDKRPYWLVQHDAEIQQYGSYRALEFLVWGLLQRPDAHYAKMAKFGRTNERCMLARSLLAVLSQSEVLPVHIRTRCRDLFFRLVPHKWMLTGEFALDWELAMNRPFASGYLEETLTSMFAEDSGASNGRAVIHVANPNSRLDAANDEAKESKMQQEISNFIVAMALEAPPLDDWNIDTIAGLNGTVMARPNQFGWIPPNDHSGVAEVLPANRLIPSVTMMIEAGLVDVDAGIKLAREG